MTVMYLINHPSAQNLLNEFCVVPNHRRLTATSNRAADEQSWYIFS